MESPWGALPVNDAHVHFFSYRFFSALAEQKKAQFATLAPLLEWELPDEDPAQLASAWVEELNRRGVDKAALIASVPGDADSVIAAVRKFPQRFYGYSMLICFGGLYRGGGQRGTRTVVGGSSSGLI